MEIGTGIFGAICSKKGARRSISSAADTGTKPGRDDSAPTSMIAAPSSTIESAWLNALSSVFHLPPSEKESGVTFNMPMTSVPSPTVNSLPDGSR